MFVSRTYPRATAWTLWLFVILAADAQTNTPPLRQVSEHVFALGPVRLDKQQHTVEFPAALNMREGVIEYLLVNSRGKAYESLLRTEVEPYDIHLAMLLIGAKGSPQTPALLAEPSPPFHMNRPPGATNLPPPLAITGDAISIDVAWQAGGHAKKIRAEGCLTNLKTHKTVTRGSWTYNGSRVVNGHFLAQTEGSIVAMIDDVDAMANNPRPGHDDDQIWEINGAAVPPTNTPVQVTFTLQPQESK